MNDEAKTKKQLIAELQELRRKAAHWPSLPPAPESPATDSAQNIIATAFLENSTPIFITSLKEGRFVDVSKAFVKLIGRERREIIGNTSTGIGLITEEQRALFLQELKKCGRVENYELPLRVKGNELRHGLMNSSKIRLNGKSYLLTVVMDITNQKKTEQALRESEELYRTFINATPDMVFLKDEQLRNIVVNQALAAFFGKPAPEIIGRTDFELLPEAAAQGCRQTDREALGSNSVVTSEETIGNLVYETHKFPVPLGQNRTGVGAFIQDITARKRAEEAFRESEYLYRNLIETSPDPIIMYDLNGKLLTVNKQALRVYGAADVEEFLAEAQTIFALLPNEGQAEAAADIRTIIGHGQALKTEYQIRVRNGDLIFMEVNSSVLKDASGKDKAIISVLRDITKRKRAENMVICQRDLGLALAKAKSLEDATQLCLEAALRATGLDAGVIHIADPDKEGFRLSCQQGFSDRFAAGISQLSSSSYGGRLARQGAPVYAGGRDMQAAPNSADMLAEGIKSFAAIPFGSQDRVIGVLGVVSRVFDRLPEYCGNILESIASQIGISIARVQSEEALRESESKFRDLAEKSVVGVYLIQDSILKYVNAEFARIFGYRIEELANRLGIKDVIYEKDLPLVEDKLSRRISGELQSLRYEFRIRTKTGEIRNAEAYSSRTLYQGRPAVIGTVLDITDRLNAEKDLRRLRIAIDHAAEDIVITDPDGIIQYVNPAFEKITGYSREEAIGKTPRILKSGMHDQAFYRHLWETIRSGQVWMDRITNRCKDGRLIMEDATISPLLASDGELTGYVALKRDVTEAVKLEAQLRQSQKMEAIGTLAGGIAHDFNNILGAMMGYAELARLRATDKKLSSYLEQILIACDRSRNLVKQILTFSRQTEHEKKPTLLTPLIREVIDFIRASLPATIEIRQTISEGNYAIMADYTQMHQVLMNLCTNSGQAMKKKGGSLEIGLQEVVLDAKNSWNNLNLPAGRYVELSVRDTGHGISPKNLERIFDPYFTTKEKGEGTGLGLAVVHGIVKDHGGEIKVYSEEAKGTLFLIYLPLIENRSEEKTVAPDAGPQGKGETILFVDDEEMIAAINKELLEQCGYRVVAQTDPLKAVAALKEGRQTFDLVITDKTMPHMTGFDLAREIRSFDRNMPIIVCSGFKEKNEAENMAALGISLMLIKPILISDMASAIRAVLDKKTAG